MPEEITHNSETIPEGLDQNAGARATEIDQNPANTQERGRNASEGKFPNSAGGGIAPSTAEEHVPGTSDPEPTDLPTANAPNP